MRGPDGAPHQLAAAVRASAVQHVLRAVAAPGALVGADEHVRRRRVEVAVAAFAVWSQLKHATSMPRLAGKHPPVVRGGYVKMLTARAITSPRTASEPIAWMVMASLAQRASGITSVGLNAVALVRPR